MVAQLKVAGCLVGELGNLGLLVRGDLEIVQQPLEGVKGVGIELFDRNTITRIVWDSIVHGGSHSLGGGTQTRGG